MKGKGKKIMEKLTKAQKYEKIEKILATVDGEDAAMLVEFCVNERNALAKKAAKAKETAAVKKTELDDLAHAVLAVITDEPKTRDEITDLVDFDEVTVAKVGTRLTKLIDQGYVVKSEVASTTPSGKKSSRKAYSLVNKD